MNSLFQRQKPHPETPPSVGDPFARLLLLQSRLAEARAKSKAADAECATGADGTEATRVSFKTAADTREFWRTSVANLEEELTQLRGQIGPAGHRLRFAVISARRACLEAVRRLAAIQIEPSFAHLRPKTWSSCLQKEQFERQFSDLVEKSSVVVEERRRQIGATQTPDDFKTHPEDFLSLVAPYRIEEARCIAKVAAVDEAIRSGGALKFDDDAWTKRLPANFQPTTARLNLARVPEVSEENLRAAHNSHVAVWLRDEKNDVPHFRREIPEDPRPFSPRAWRDHCAKQNARELAGRRG